MRPTNASARAAPSARAVRFYVANGLLDRPEGTGTSATYNYRHLLQLLAIKIRQREGQTLDVIKREMREVTGDALERRVATSLAPALMTGAGAALAARVDDEGPAAWRRWPWPTASSCTCATTRRPRARTRCWRCARRCARRWGGRS
jgi:DNA-binding transcriptional MerR regulator